MAADTGKKRIVHYDLLRIVAAFSVVMLHSAAQFWYTIPVTQTEWKIANCYDALFRFGVPIFVMLSGALFLGREIEVKRLYKHNILRLLIVYLVWSVIYGLFDYTKYNLTEINGQALVQEVIGGRYHLWFLPMIIGIYMLLPILQLWVCSAKEKDLRYFLLLFFVVKILGQTISVLIENEVVHYLLNIFNASELQMVCSYIGYFVLGYYLVSVEISKKWQKVIYVAVIPSIILNIVIDNYMSVKANAPSGVIYDSFGLFTFIIVVAIFLFFTQVVGKVHFGSRAERIIQEVSAATFGIYLAHLLCMEWLERMGIHSMTFSNIIGIPLLAIGVFAICFVFAALIRRIPFVGKYIC